MIIGLVVARMVLSRAYRKVVESMPGDKVLMMAPGRFSTVERAPEWAVCHIYDNESYTTMATMPISFSTALYALSHRAKLSAGETVLIHSAAGGLGLAAIQVSKLVRARIFATVGSEVKKKFLVENHGLNPNHIFNSRNVSSFVVAATAATNGRGFDVVLNSLSGEHLHESWRLCTEFGRFIEVGKRDIIEYGRLDMEVFKRATTFTAFDLTSLYYSENRSQNQIWRK